MNVSFTSLENWIEFVNSGDTNFLDDIDIQSAPTDTRVVISGEGWEREAFLGDIMNPKK